MYRLSLSLAASFLVSSLFLISQGAGAQTIFVAVGGNDLQPGTLANPKATLQAAFNALPPTGGTIQVQPGRYVQQLAAMDKSFTLQGATTVGSAKPVITWTSGPLNQKLIELTDCPNTTIRGLQLDVDQSYVQDGLSAIEQFDNLRLIDLEINAIGSDSTRVSGGGQLVFRQGIILDGSRLQNNPTVTLQNITINPTVGQSPGTTWFFNRGIVMRSVRGTVGGADTTLRCQVQAERDVLVQFANGPVTIAGNHFDGGGVDVTLPGQTGVITISNNRFRADPRVNTLLGELTLIKHNPNGGQVNLTGNRYLNHATVAVRAAGTRNTTISGNTFRPLPTGTLYRHIEVDTRWQGETQTPLAPNSVTIRGNDFGAGTAGGGMAIMLRNGRKGEATGGDFESVTIGGTGAQANTFRQGLAKFVRLDAQPGQEFDLNLDMADNLFEVGARTARPAQLTQAELFVVEDKLDHAPDVQTIGLIRLRPTDLYVTPRSFYPPFTTVASVQRGVNLSQPGHVLNLRDTAYVGPVTVDKELLFLPSDTLTSLESLGMVAGATDRLRIRRTMTVRGQLSLNSGNVYLGRANLRIAAPSASNPPAGFATSYVETDSTGMLVVQTLGAGVLNFPVGKAGRFRPLEIANRGTPDQMGVRMLEDTYRQGTTGPPTDTTLSFSYVLREGTPGGGRYDITWRWGSADEKPDFIRNRILMQRYVGRWETISGPNFLTVTGQDPFEATGQDMVTTFSGTPIRLFAPIEIPDTIFYVDNLTGIDDAVARSGRTPLSAWRSVNFTVDNATRVAPSGNIYVRIRTTGQDYEERVTIPATQSRIFIRGGYFGADAAPRLTLGLAGQPDHINILANQVSLRKLDIITRIDQVPVSLRGVEIDDLYLDSCRILNAGDQAITNSVAVDFLGQGAGRLRMRTVVIEGNNAASQFGYGVGLLARDAQLELGGALLQRILIRARRDVEARTLRGSSVVRNSVFAGLEGLVLEGDPSVTTADLVFVGNNISHSASPISSPDVSLTVANYAAGQGTVLLDSNQISDQAPTTRAGAAGMLLANNRSARVSGTSINRQAPAQGYTAIIIDNALDNVLPANNTQELTLTRNLLGLPGPGGPLTTGVLIGQRQPLINPVTVTLGAVGAPNRFNAGYAKFISLNAPSGAHGSDVNAAQNSFGLTGSLEQLPAQMSVGDLLNVEDKIDHKIDWADLGLVRLVPTRLFVTPLSFLPPQTLRPAMGRAVSPSSEGHEIVARAGRYFGDFTIDKTITLSPIGPDVITDELTMAAPQGELTLNGILTLQGSGGLTLNEGHIVLATGDLIVGDSAPFIGTGSPASFVRTNATGGVIYRALGGGARTDSALYPIGRNNSYLPCWIQNDGGRDDFKARVTPNNLRQATTGTEADSVVRATWWLSEAAPGGGRVKVTLQWSAADERDDFDRTRVGMQLYNGTRWAYVSNRRLQRAAGNDPYRIRDTVSTGLANTPLRVYSLLPDNDIFIPTLFSPNGDDVNDRLLVYGNTIQEMTLQIYNRYGNLIYESSDPVELTTRGWDGTHRGQPCNTGQYVWRMRGRFRDGRPISVDGRQNGTITLTR